MKYFAKKPCKFAGKSYLIGEEIPEIVLIPSRIEALKAAGVIDVVDVEPIIPLPNIKIESPFKMGVPILGNGDEGYCYQCTQLEISAVFTILQKTVEEATEIIKSEESENVLNIIGNIDSRKSIKVAASSRITELELKFESDEKPDNEEIKGDA